jgi:predicted nucleotidyltransferase
LYGSYAKGTANEYSDVDVFSYIYIWWKLY